MQIKPQTARGLGYQGGAAGLMHPETNIRYGMIYLAQAYRMSGGDTCSHAHALPERPLRDAAQRANRAYCAKARTIMAPATERPRRVRRRRAFGGFHDPAGNAHIACPASRPDGRCLQGWRKVRAPRKHGAG